LLSHVYEAVVGSAGSGLEVESVQTARQLVRSFRIRSGSANVSVLGFGAGGGTSTQVIHGGLVSPGLVVPPLLQQLVAVAEEKLDARGIVVHVNNFENLVDSDREGAADTVRDVRDLLLLHGYHYLFVGTGDALHAIVDRHAQVRSIFGMFEELPPLGSDEFVALLESRYRYLRLDTTTPAVAPVEPDTARAVYALFHGDLRGALRALDIGAHELAGYGDPPRAPMGLGELMVVLAPRYAYEMHQRLGETHARYLMQIGDLREPFTQQQLRATWRVGKGTTSEIANALTRMGYLDVERTGRTLHYRRTGAARLTRLPVGEGGSSR
jgi:hypothetical protein